MFAKLHGEYIHDLWNAMREVGMLRMHYHKVSEKAFFGLLNTVDPSAQYTNKGYRVIRENKRGEYIVLYMHDFSYYVYVIPGHVFEHAFSALWPHKAAREYLAF